MVATWSRFIDVVIDEIRAAFDAELVRQRNEHTLKVMAPQQRVEETERRKKRAEKIESEAPPQTETTGAQEEQLYEDPF